MTERQRQQAGKQDNKPNPLKTRTAQLESTNPSRANERRQQEQARVD